MSSDNDTFPGNDDIYQQILQKLEQNENIDVQKKMAIGPLSGNQINDPVRSITTLIVSPKKPIYGVGELNSFAEKNLIPLFRSFNYEEAKIKNRKFLGIPIPGQEFMTVPCLKRKDEYLATTSAGKDYETHYHILLVPDKSNAHYFSLPNCRICDKYTIKIQDLKTLSCMQKSSFFV